MSKAPEAFLIEGVGQYGRAVDTIRHFRREMESRLCEILKDRADWKRFQPSKEPFAGHGKGAALGWWIWGSVLGKLPGAGDITVGIGLWWAPPANVGHDVVLYANFEGSEALERHPYRSGTDGVYAARRTGKYTRLFMPPRADLDLDRDFGLLLSELERHADACGCDAGA